MNIKRLVQYVGRRSLYVFQKLTGYGFDTAFEQELSRQAKAYLSCKSEGERFIKTVPRLAPSEIVVADCSRFVLVRDDIYKRFLADESGYDLDHFGRRGYWVPRGSQIFYDRKTSDFVKIFDEHFCSRGEGTFLRAALDAGVYDFLCPNLSYIIQDDNGLIRGYAIREGKPLTLYEFERYVGGALRDVICEVTRRSGFYFYDLEFHNVIRSEGRISLIDLESVLPLGWFGKGIAYAREHLDLIDIGWPLNEKWRSPNWYREFLIKLVAGEMHPPTQHSTYLSRSGYFGR